MQSRTCTWGDDHAEIGYSQMLQHLFHFIPTSNMYPRPITMSRGKRFASAITHRMIRDRWHHRGSWLGPDEYGWGAYNPIHCIWADNEIIIISIVLAAIEIPEHRLLALDKRCRIILFCAVPKLQLICNCSSNRTNNHYSQLPTYYYHWSTRGLYLYICLHTIDKPGRLVPELIMITADTEYIDTKSDPSEP